MSSAEFDPAESVEDRVGLDRAYAGPRKVYMEGDSMYVAGTSSLGDARDDLALPFGLTKGTQRYIDAERVLQANPRSVAWSVTAWEEPLALSSESNDQTSKREPMGRLLLA